MGKEKAFGITGSKTDYSRKSPQKIKDNTNHLKKFLDIIGGQAPSQLKSANIQNLAEKPKELSFTHPIQTDNDLNAHLVRY